VAKVRVGSGRKAERAPKSTDFPQPPPAPDDYPVFPDKSTWPVVFPELPPSSDGGPSRPPQHISKAVAPRIPADRLPNHVAIVMDGNGRWATQRGLTRVEGHKMGEAVVIDIVCGAIELGIRWLSLYAFSTENWKRSPEEVRFLMGFNRDVVRRRRENLKEIGVNIRWVGSRPRLWRSVINELAIAEAMTRDNDVITVNYCVNYGGRAEIAEAARDIARLAAAGRLDPERVGESTVARHLQRPDIPDVDLFLRTSGEQRSSNFMLWQAAYAEYIFQDKLWPDYDRRDLWAACEEYASRNRRFGSA
jgi:trans,polycis-decaprenyl diphosphate synthase